MVGKTVRDESLLRRKETIDNLMKQKEAIQAMEKPEGQFNWTTLEFDGHEGEYDESVDGEQQDKNLMAALKGLGVMMSPDEPEMSKEDQEELNELKKKLEDLLAQLEGIAVEAGIDLDDGSIGETGFDMYHWSFTEGNTVKGDGWTIAIPDGFVQRKSKDVEPTTGNKRLFELVR